MIKQLSIFLENSPGRLCEATRILGEGGFNMHALTVADTNDYGVARILCDRPEEAAAYLIDKGMVARTQNVWAICVPDVAGSLASLLGLLASEGIDVGYCYCFVNPTTKDAANVFKLDREPDRNLLLTHGYRLLETAELG